MFCFKTSQTNNNQIPFIKENLITNLGGWECSLKASCASVWCHIVRSHEQYHMPPVPTHCVEPVRCRRQVGRTAPHLLAILEKSKWVRIQETLDLFVISKYIRKNALSITDFPSILIPSCHFLLLKSTINPSNSCTIIILIPCFTQWGVYPYSPLTCMPGSNLMGSVRRSSLLWLFHTKLSVSATRFTSTHCPW